MHSNLPLSLGDLSSWGQMPLPESLVGLSVPAPSSLNLSVAQGSHWHLPISTPTSPPLSLPSCHFLSQAQVTELPGPSEVVSSLWGHFTMWLPLSRFSQKPIQGREIDVKPRLNKSLVEQPW